MEKLIRRILKEIREENPYHQLNKILEDRIDIPYYYDEISNLLYALGFDDVKQMEDDELSDFYYKLVADTILENK